MEPMTVHPCPRSSSTQAGLKCRPVPFECFPIFDLKQRSDESGVVLSRNIGVRHCNVRCVAVLDTIPGFPPDGNWLHTNRCDTKVEVLKGKKVVLELRFGTLRFIG